MCIGNTGDLEEAHYELLGVFYAISEGVSLDLLQPVHNKLTQLEENASSKRIFYMVC